MENVSVVLAEFILSITSEKTNRETLQTLLALCSFALASIRVIARYGGNHRIPQIFEIFFFFIMLISLSVLSAVATSFECLLARPFRIGLALYPLGPIYLFPT